MTKLHELKDFDRQRRPVTQRLSLARLDGDVPTGVSSGNPQGALTNDTLAAWIRESGPPPSQGSEPVEIEGSRTVRLPAREHVPLESGHRVRPRTPPRGLAVLRGAELIVCVALWSLLALWLVGATLRLPEALSPVGELADGVTTVHGQLVERLAHLIARD